MKKGFSLIEMAIVAIIAGIIIAMIVDASGLVDSAKIKSEIQKIRKIEVAVGTFYMQYDRLPGSVPVNGAPAFSSQAIYEELISNELLQDSDFNSTYLKAFWSFYGCDDDQINNINNPNGRYWNPGLIETSDGFCLIALYENPRKDKRVEKISISNSSAMSDRFGCYFDTYMDDRNFYQGRGRQTLRNSEAHINMKLNCDQYADGLGGLGGAYMFRIF